MAAHNWLKDRLFAARRTYEIPFTIVTGATGAVSSFSSKKEGVSSITRSAAGRYPIVLDAKYGAFMYVNACVFVAGTGAYTANKATRFILRDSNSGGTTVTLQFIDMAVNTDQDVQDSAVIKGCIVARDS